MPLMLPKTSNYQIAPAGTHNFCCYQILDLGTQTNVTYNSKARNIALFFELIGTDMGDGRPFTMAKKFTLSWGKKANLKAFLTSWLPNEEFGDKWEFSSLLMKTGMMLVTHDKSDDGSKTYANIKSVMPLPGGMKLDFKLHNMPRVFLLDESFKTEDFNELPEYWRGLIENSPEFKECYQRYLYSGATSEKPKAASVAGDEIPF